MKILIACEESQRVCKAFRDKGHEAYSCDILPTSGNNPEWHLQQDVVPLLKENWDMVIAFPPCTHLTVAGTRHFKKKQETGEQQQGINFFLQFTNLPHIKKVVIENPKGIMSTHYRKPDQIIQPYYFSDPVEKMTCLWLKGVPLLKETNRVPRKRVRIGKNFWDVWYYETSLLPYKERSKVRSKTFPGIASAMAEQWG
jgi:site-specific DNA-cytosine methylase